MNTIEEKIRKGKENFQTDAEIMAYSLGFKDGINFSEEWIDVNERIPIGVGNCLVKIIVNEGVEFIVQAKYDSTGFYGFVVKQLLLNDNDVKFVAWKPLELK